MSARPRAEHPLLLLFSGLVKPEEGFPARVKSPKAGKSALEGQGFSAGKRMGTDDGRWRRRSHLKLQGPHPQGCVLSPNLRVGIKA